MRRAGWLMLAAIAWGCGGGEDDGEMAPVATTISAGGIGTDEGGDTSDGGDTGDPDPGDESDSTDDGGPADTGSSDGPTESCNDGELNGDESDVDCGGSCDACLEGQSCVGSADCMTGACDGGLCGEAASCLSILQGRPDAETGPYEIHPDGGAAIDVWCDMDRAGGGWTLTFAANGVDFDVADAVPMPAPGSAADLFTSTGVRYQQFAAHSEEMFVCTTGEGETPNYEVRTFEAIPRFWDQSLDNAEIFVTGTMGTSDASATEYCAGLVWGGCNLDHYGYAVYQAEFGSANWGRWSGNSVYGPKGAELYCFANGDQTDNPDAWFWHFVR